MGALFELVNGAIMNIKEFNELQKKREEEWEEFIQGKPEYYTREEFNRLRKDTIEMITQITTRSGQKVKELSGKSYIGIKSIKAEKSFEGAKIELSEARKNDQKRYCELIVFHSNKALNFLFPGKEFGAPEERMIGILREIKETFPDYSLNSSNLEAFEILILSRLKKLK